MSRGETAPLDVVAIGGGIAGLVSARDLGESGATVAVLEARDRLGGRTWSRTLRGTEVLVEIGGTWFARDLQPAIASEISRYDLQVRSSSPYDHAVWQGTTDRREGAGPIPTFGPLFAPARPRLDSAIAAIRESYASSGTLPPSEDMAAGPWIESLDVPLSTKEILLAWMAVIGGGDPAAQSLLIMTSDLALTGFAIEDSLDTLRETFEHGTATLVAALAADVRGPIRRNAVVTRITQNEGGVRVTLADGSLVDALTAVVALPLNCLADIEFDPPLQPLKQRAATERHPGTSTKVLALATGFEPPMLGFAWAQPLQGVVTMHAVDGGRLVAGFDGIGALVDPNDPAEIEAALRVFAPEATVLAAESHDWIADRFSQGTWLTWPPGWAAEVGNELSTPEGRLAFAGSDLAIDGGGYIEGAITSGRAAAETVVARLRELPVR